MDVDESWRLSVSGSRATRPTSEVSITGGSSGWFDTNASPVAHPQYPNQRHPVNVYDVAGTDPPVRFFAGEFSNGVWASTYQTDHAEVAWPPYPLARRVPRARLSTWALGVSERMLSPLVGQDVCVPECRLAIGEDAEGVARVHVSSWQIAYWGILPDDYLDSLKWERRFDFWSRELVEPGRQGSRTWVLVAGAAVLGFASTGPARDDDRQSSGAWELYGIYLAPDRWGHGNGRRLLETALADIPDQVADVSLWVLAENVRARRFYERLGFATDGCVRVDTLGGLDVAEVRYLRAR